MKSIFVIFLYLFSLIHGETIQEKTTYLTYSNQCCRGPMATKCDTENGDKCLRLVNSFEECQENCDKNPWCKQFVLGKTTYNNNQCWLESECTSVQENCEEFDRFVKPEVQILDADVFDFDDQFKRGFYKVMIPLKNKSELLLTVIDWRGRLEMKDLQEEYETLRDTGLEHGLATPLLPNEGSKPKIYAVEENVFEEMMEKKHKQRILFTNQPEDAYENVNIVIHKRENGMVYFPGYKLRQVKGLFIHLGTDINRDSSMKDIHRKLTENNFNWNTNTFQQNLRTDMQKLHNSNITDIQFFIEQGGNGKICLIDPNTDQKLIFKKAIFQFFHSIYPPQYKFRENECCTGPVETKCGTESGENCLRKVKNTEKCQKLCEEQPWCKQFVYGKHGKSGQCWLESTCTSVQENCGEFDRYVQVSSSSNLRGSQRF